MHLPGILDITYSLSGIDRKPEAEPKIKGPAPLHDFAIAVRVCARLRSSVGTLGKQAAPEPFGTAGRWPLR
jgi:hypothetical protein